VDQPRRLVERLTSCAAITVWITLAIWFVVPFATPASSQMDDVLRALRALPERYQGPSCAPSA